MLSPAARRCSARARTVLLLLASSADCLTKATTTTTTERAASQAFTDARQLSPIRSSATSRHFFDEHGRVRIFHGAARVEKNPPWYFKDLVADSSEAEAMGALGFNVLRLGFMWSGYNPAPGVFNRTYIDVIKQTVQLLNDQGVYVLLDMHQDIISSKFCLYDGAPRWVIDKSQPTHKYPFPLAPSGAQGDNCTRTGSPNSPCNCSAWPWSENALTVAAATAYQDIYDNKHGMLDDLTRFWVEAAKEFKEIPGVIGYEIMNEPFAGNIFEQPELVLPGVAGRRNLQRMHDAVATKIREVDTQHIIFYEPVTWGMIFDGNISGSGFEHVPGGDVWQNASAYAYHYYCMSWLPGWETQPVQRKLLCDAAIAPSVFRAVGEDIDRIGGAAMMTEGLACNQDNETQQQECIAVQNDLDSNLFSWTDYGDSQGEAWDVHPVQQRLWARTYARAVAGTPINMTFDIMNKFKPFEFCFLVDRRIQAPTEVWTSSRFHYPRGVVVAQSPNLNVVADKTRDGVFLVTPKGMDGPRDEIGCVRMTAKQ